MTELAKRVRAARAYAGYSQAELADLLDIDAQTIKRMEAGRRDPRLPEQWAIAEVCRIPRDFFGKPGWASVSTLDEKLDAIIEGQIQVRDLLALLQHEADDQLVRDGQPTAQPADAQRHRPARARARGEQ